MLEPTNFGERITSGDVKVVKNKIDDSEYPAIVNREFTEVKQFIVDNSEAGASDIVFNHLTALFNAIPVRKIDVNNPNVCTLTIIPVADYNQNVFTTNIETSVSFGYTIVEQDSPLRSWKIYYMSFGNNVYCVTYSSTYKRITVTSRT